MATTRAADIIRNQPIRPLTPAMAAFLAQQQPEVDADEPIVTLECMICFERVAEKSIIHPCPRCPSHQWCSDCVEDIFLNAITKQGFSPPTCCGFLQLHTIVDRLSPKMARQYRALFKEWLTKDKKYCPIPTCSAFLDPDYLRSLELGATANFQCPSCTADICIRCEQPAHEGACDLSTKAEEAAMLARFKIKQCPRCRRSIKKMHGCPHMACICGAHFCWYCNRSTDHCYGDCGSDRDDIDDDDDGDGDEESDEDGVNESAGDDDIRTMTGDITADENKKPKTEKDDAAGIVHDAVRHDAGLPAQMLLPPPPPAPGLVRFGAPAMPDILSNGALLSDTIRRANDAIRETVLGPAYPAPPPPPIRPSGRPANPRPANLRPANTRPVDLDAGGEARWANAEEDFGEEPGDEPNGQVWSCRHLFRPYYYPPKSVTYRGRLEFMECNRCFSRVVPTPLDPAAGSPEAKRRKTNGSVESSTAASAVGRRGSNAALECFKCCLVVCEACKEKFEVEGEEDD